MARSANDGDEQHITPEGSRPRYLGGVAASDDPSAPASPWLTYAQAAAYTGWTIVYLRNLVSAGLIPVHGKPRVRRFRKDELDSFLHDPDAALRRFRAERNRNGG